MLLITVTEYQVHTTLVTISRSWVQRSRWQSDVHRNLMNSLVPESLKGFQPKLDINISNNQAIKRLGFEDHCW